MHFWSLFLILCQQYLYEMLLKRLREAKSRIIIFFFSSFTRINSLQYCLQQLLKTLKLKSFPVNIPCNLISFIAGFVGFLLELHKAHSWCQSYLFLKPWLFIQQACKIVIHLLYSMLLQRCIQWCVGFVEKTYSNMESRSGTFDVCKQDRTVQMFSFVSFLVEPAVFAFSSCFCKFPRTWMNI